MVESTLACHSEVNEMNHLPSWVLKLLQPSEIRLDLADDALPYVGGNGFGGS
jgi:hypothetical protein